MAAIRERLQEIDAESVFSMDEIGPFFRIVPNRSYLLAEQRRLARGRKSMKAKERVSLVLAWNATGSRQVPVGVIGKSARRLSFRPAWYESPLAYLTSATVGWTVQFSRGGWRRLFCRTCGPVRRKTAHSSAISSPPIRTIRMISCSSLLFSLKNSPRFHHFDAEIIQALKTRYKRRFLSSMVAFVDNPNEQPATTRTMTALENSGRVSLVVVTRIICEEWTGTRAESIARSCI